MFHLCGKLISNNRILADSTICNDDPFITRTKKIFVALDTICHDFDLSVPIWLDSNIEEFQRTSRTRFYKDNFIDEIDFDYLQIEVTQEDED